MTSLPPNTSPLSDTEWDANELETLGHCPICQSTARTVLYDNLTDTLFRCAPGRWTLHACNGCGTAYLDPRPSATSLGKAYANYYTHSEAENKISAPDAPSWRRALLKFARATFNSYLNARWQLALTPSNAWGRYLVLRVSQARALAEQKLRHMPSQPLDRPGSLLDVGCGNGAFLQTAQAAGWSVQGIDFDPIAVAEARRQGLAVELGGIDQLTDQVQTYDWITCSHVLEHVHHLQELLHSLHRLLRPGGTLWLQTPNIDSLGHRAYGPHWRGLEPPRHLTLLTLPSLRSAMEKAGFKTKFCRMPLFTAMSVHAASHAMSNGDENAMALPHARILRLRFLLLALRQHWRLGRAEFHTVVATR
jgi:2-polyprenyl-3-methyl-5-hydroxy-6-metoxy-1,4-benzoquinol methylase